MEDENKKVNIKVNGNNEITAYAIVGGVNGIDVPVDILPDNFREDFDAKYFLYADGEVTVNPDYVAPEIHI